MWGLYAALFEPPLRSLYLTDLAARNRDAPDLLNVSRIVETPQVVAMAADRVERVILRAEATQGSRWASTAWPAEQGRKIVVQSAQD